MTVVLVFLGGAALLTVLGVAVLLLAPTPVAARVLPAAPILGVAYLVVAMHLFGMVVPASIAIWLAVVPALAVIAVGVVRHRDRIALLSSGWRGAVVTWTIGTAAAIIALTPQILAGSTGIVQLTASNDAFYYVSMSEWLADHAIFDSPDMGSAPSVGSPSPAFGDVWVGLLWGLRLGQELVAAGLASTFGISASAALPGLLALWIALLPGAAWVVGSAFGTRRETRILLAMTASVLPTALHQVVNHNADSLLGSSLALLTIALVTTAVRSSGAWSAPLWIAAISLAALVGTYTEYLPFVGVVLVAVVLIRPRAQVGSAVIRAGAIIGVALVVAPLVWVRAARSLLVVAGVAAVPGSTPPDVVASARRVLGGLPGSAVRDLPGEPNVLLSGLAAAAAALILIGLACGLITLRTRGLSVGAGLAIAVAVLLAVRSGDYVAGRAVDMVTPIILAAGLVGWDVPLRRVGGAASRAVLVTIAAVLVVAVTSTGLQLFRGERSAVAGAHVVDAEYSVLSDWATREAPEGQGVVVATSAFFEQLWASDALRDLDGVGYVTLRGDLGYRGDTTMSDYWDGSLPRVLIAGPGAFVAGEDQSITDSSGRFSRIDFGSGRAVVAVPVTGGAPWSWASSGPTGGESGGTVLLLSNRDSLAGCELDATADVPLAVTQAGRSTEDLSLDNVRLTDGVAHVQIERPDGTGPITLEGIHCAS